MFSDHRSESEENNRKKIYLCRRCLNHGREIPKRGHNCQYTKCECPKCKLLKDRRDLSILKNQMEIEVDVVGAEENKSKKSEDVKATKRGFHTYCSLCKNHDRHNLFEKGHKRVCKFQNCDCKLCRTTRQYNDVMAQQMKVRRNQNKEKKQRHLQEMLATSSKIDLLKHWEFLSQQAEASNGTSSYGICNPRAKFVSQLPPCCPIGAPLSQPICSSFRCGISPVALQNNLSSLLCQSHQLSMLASGCFFPLVPETVAQSPDLYSRSYQSSKLGTTQFHSPHSCLGCLQEQSRPLLMQAALQTSLRTTHNSESWDTSSDQSSPGTSAFSHSSTSPPISLEKTPSDKSHRPVTVGSLHANAGTATDSVPIHAANTVIGCRLPTVSADI